MSPTGPVPRDLTPEEVQARTELCFGLMQQIKEGLTKGRVAMWETARALHEFDEQNGWTVIGYESLAHWLADPEVDMGKTMYYRLVSCYRETVAIRRADFDTVKQLDPSKVDVVIPALSATCASSTGRVHTARWRRRGPAKSFYVIEGRPVSPRTCQFCGASLTHHHRHARYCSAACRASAWRLARSTGKDPASPRKRSYVGGGEVAQNLPPKAWATSMRSA